MMMKVLPEIAGKIAERDVVDALEDGAHLHKAALPAGQIDLRDVAGDDDFRTEPKRVSAIFICSAWCLASSKIMKRHLRCARA